MYNALKRESGRMVIMVNTNKTEQASIPVERKPRLQDNVVSVSRELAEITELAFKVHNDLLGPIPVQNNESEEINCMEDALFNIKIRMRELKDVLMDICERL
jgi:hypothetical protein